MKARLLSAIAVVVGAVVLAVAPAGADGPGGGGMFDGPPPSEPQSPDMEVHGSHASFVPGGGLTGSSDPNCTAPGGQTGPATSEPPPMPQQFYFDHADQYYAPAAGQPGEWRMRYCGGVPDQIIFIPAGGGGFGIQVQGVLPLLIDAPTIRMNPDEDEHQLVGLRSWLWVEGQTSVSQTTEVVPGVTLHLAAEPRSVRWDLGDDTAETSCDLGRPYDPNVPDDQQQPSCSHTYEQSSAGHPGDAFRVEASVEWVAVECSINGRTCTAAEWPVPVHKTSTRSVVVAEREALNRTTEG